VKVPDMGASIQKKGAIALLTLGEITSRGIGVGRCRNDIKRHFYPY